MSKERLCRDGGKAPYIRALKIIHRPRLQMIEDFYNTIPFEMTFNEFLVQAHYDWLRDQNKLTAKNMFYKLPKEYMWIAKRFLINQTNRVKVDWKKALVHLKIALVKNKSTNEPLQEYQQAHSPLLPISPTSPLTKHS